MELTQSSETLAYKIQTPGKFPEDNILEIKTVPCHDVKAYGRLKLQAPAAITWKNILRRPLQRSLNGLHSRSGSSGKYILVILQSSPEVEP
jgi:hypothetical protein